MRRLGFVSSTTYLLVLAAAMKAQTIDPQALLSRVRSQVVETVQHAPRYSCTEAIERFWYGNRKHILPGCDTDRPPQIIDRNLVRRDRLKLDVAVGSGQEMFSWHGQKRFQTEEIDKLVTAGPISSGTYFSFLSSIFLEGSAAIDFRCLRSQDNKQVAVFGYAVPLDKSDFETRTDSGKQLMGYHGEFTVSIQSSQLEQLEVVTDEMPPAARVCSFTMKTRYAAAQLNGRDFQLPANVVMDILHSDHELTRTATQYRDCHEFLGESVLRFDDVPSTPAAVQVRSSKTLPAGLPLKIRIQSGINPASAWAGDPVAGEVADDVRDERGSLLAPKGSVVRGRLLRLETWMRPYRYYTAVLQFYLLTLNTGDYELHLTSIVRPASIEGGSIPSRMQLENPPTSDEPGACRFRLNDKQANLKGAVTYWITD